MISPIIKHHWVSQPLGCEKDDNSRDHSPCNLKGSQVFFELSSLCNSIPLTSDRFKHEHVMWVWPTKH